jgi:membrane AbrB-like protein
MAQFFRLLATALWAVACGSLAQLIGMPLPWLLGPMFGVGLLTFLGWGGRQPSFGRKAGQMTIGIALGLYFTQAAIAQLIGYAGWMAAGAAASLLTTVFCARYFQKLARVDGLTATYACAIGAASDMALQAQRRGADGASVATSHAVRVMLVVTVVPFVALLFGQAAVDSALKASMKTTEIGLEALLGIAVVSTGLALLIRKTRFPSPWILVPLFTAAAYAVLGNETRLPHSAVNAGSLLIGWNLGQFMTKEFFTSAPRVLFAALVMTIIMLLLSLVFALILNWAAGIPVLSALVATAPGGVAEMALTAKVLGLGAPLVTAFHLFRLLAVLLLTSVLAQAMIKRGWLSACASAKI